MSGATYSGRYPLALPPDGQYTVHVRATDGAGNTTPAGSQVTLSFKIDTVKPPAPIFDSTPPNPNSTATSTFVWHDTAVDVDHYLCSTENGSFLATVPSLGGPTQPCSSPLTYNVQTTNNGQHQFAVEAVDAAGNVSLPISYSWKVAAGTPAQFVIHGSVSGLAPGITKPVPLTIDNPNSVAIFITQLTFAVSANASSGTCLASSYTVTPWNSNPPTIPDLQVPANATGFVVPLASAKHQADQLGGQPRQLQGHSPSPSTFSGSAHLRERPRLERLHPAADEPRCAQLIVLQRR